MLARGFSLVEAMVAMVIVGVMVAAAMQTVGSARLGQFRTSLASTGAMLAQQLMTEILEQAYEDPDGTPVFGPEAGEVVGSSRSKFDDVDDYNGYSCTPPRTRDGTARDDLANWRCSVVVDYVKTTDINATIGSNSGIKRITVALYYRNARIAQQAAIRTAAWPSAVER